MSDLPLRRRTTGRLSALAGAVAVALIGFGVVFGWGLLRADAPFWSNPHGDMGQMLAGEIAGLRAPWGLPLLVTRTLTAPEPVSLVYTDSIPGLTALLKALHLGNVLSLMGTFLLIAWVAQAAAAYGLLRAWGVRRPLTLFCGSVMALLLPAWLGRQIGHIGLSAHAFEIAGLALAVRSIRGGVDRAGLAGFFALAIAAVGVHAYHLPPLLLMFGAALGSDVLQGRAGAVRRLWTAGGAFLATVVVAAWVCGYFVGRGVSGGAAALGVFEMNMLAPFVPQATALSGSRWADGWFTHIQLWDPSGAQVFEGFNYLGAGVLLLGAAALVLLVRSRRTAVAGDAPPQVDWRRWGPLWLALAALTAYAVGPRPWLGDLQLGALPLPRSRWFEPLAMFRGHGRFFWTVAYAALAGSVAGVDRMAGPRLRSALLLAAVALQAADVSVMLDGLHQRFARPEPLHVPAALAGPAFHGRSLRMFPEFYCTRSVDNMARIRQLSLIAQRQEADTNSAETVRPPLDNCAAPAPDLTRDAAPGDRRITVVQRGDDRPTPFANAFAGRGDCYAYGDGVWFCGRELAGVPGLRKVAGLDLATATSRDTVVDLVGPSRSPALLSGWSGPEAHGVWSDGPRAVLRLPHPALGAGAGAGAVLTIELEALGYQPAGRAPQRVRISIDGRPAVERLLPGGDYQTVTVRTPAAGLPPGPLDVAFDLPDARSPSAATPPSPDPRVLGIGLRRATVLH